jgi:hypothetical protein
MAAMRKQACYAMIFCPHHPIAVCHGRQTALCDYFSFFSKIQ